MQVLTRPLCERCYASAFSFVGTSVEYKLLRKYEKLNSCPACALSCHCHIHNIALHDSFLLP